MADLGDIADRAIAATGRVCDLIEPYLPPDGALVRLSIPAWLLCLACLAPAVWRIALRRPRDLDPIWGLVALLALNRLSFLMHISTEISHVSALLLALAMAAMTVSYQRWDKDRVR